MTQAPRMEALTSTPSGTSTVADASAWATEAAGWAVLLTAPGLKRPHWRTPTVHDATRDTGLLQAWIHETPGVGVAVNLGASNLAAIEDDGPAGLAALTDLQARHGPLPATWMIQARRGRHRVYRARDVRSRRLGPELELRARGQYILLPPTVVGGATRHWITSTLRRPLAPLPDWLAHAAQVQIPIRTAEITSSDRLARLAVEEVRARLSMRPAKRDTGRGTALFAAACSLGRHVHAGTLTQEQAIDALRQAAAPLRLTPYERDRSIRRGLELGPGRST